LSVILVHPPISKPSEPPAGVARLAGALREHGFPCTVVDANLEGILGLLDKTPASSDPWTSRAYRHLPAHLRLLRRPEGYGSLDRYRRAVLDINRVIEKSFPGSPVRISFANYSDNTLSPLRSEDLFKIAARPERSPFYKHFQQSIRRILKDENPKAIGFSLNYLSQALSVFSMIGILKQEHPRLRIMLGGGLVTSWMSRPAWKNPFQGLVDELVKGPGERALLSAFERYGADLGGPPDYEVLGKLPYFSPGFILPYSTSSGCYWRRCSFCPERAEGNAYQPTSPKEALAEVASLAASMRPVLIHFLDNAMSPGLLEELARQGLEIPWYGFARFTHHLRSLDFCHALKRSGCIMLKLGLESGDQEVLDRLEKGIDLETASAVLNNLKTAGIGTYVYLLFGTPAETQEKAESTLEFTVRHGACIDFLNVAVFNMPAGGSEAERYSPKPFYKGDLSLYTDFAHPLGWNRALVRNFLDRSFKRHPVIAGILRRDPPFFSSNHAPFFVTGFPSRLRVERQMAEGKNPCPDY
jgi:hypothetical protein